MGGQERHLLLFLGRDVFDYLVQFVGLGPELLGGRLERLQLDDLVSLEGRGYIVMHYK